MEEERKNFMKPQFQDPIKRGEQFAMSLRKKENKNMSTGKVFQQKSLIKLPKDMPNNIIIKSELPGSSGMSSRKEFMVDLSGGQTKP